MSRNSVAVWTLSAAFATGLARADLIFEQQPSRNGGYAGDLDFYSDSGVRVWQQTADDFDIQSDAIVGRVSFYGFYGGSYSGSLDPPSGDETIRIRLYATRPADGLPGSVLYDESFLNPSRVPTGEVVATARAHPEYFYEVESRKPMALSANITYWLEIVQVDLVDSHFRWEGSGSTGSPFAFLNPNVADWTLSAPLNNNMAFRLSTIPEPATLVLSTGGIVMGWREGRRLRRRS